MRIFLCQIKVLHYEYCHVYHFVPIIIIYGSSLFCSSIMMILLTLVVSSRLWLILQWIMFSIRLPITIWFPFTKARCLWNLYISANLWKRSTDCWPSTNNFNLFIFNRLLFFMLSHIFWRLWCTVKCTFVVVDVVLIGHP